MKKKIDKKQFNNILSKHFGTIRGGEVYRIVQKIVGDATIDKVMSVPVKDSADAANIASQQVSETEINEAQNVTEPEDTDVWADAQEELPAEKECRRATTDWKLCLMTRMNAISSTSVFLNL